MTFTSATVLLFVVIDPFGNIPFFVSALGHLEPERRRRVLLRELLVALAVLIAFLFAGPFVLDMLQVSGAALTVAGGVVLFLIAVRMVFPRPTPAEEILDEPFIVPLAVPYIAGPSAMASVLLIMNREPQRWPEWLAAIVVAWLFAGLIIGSSTLLLRRLGARTVVAIERLMGMLLVTVAAQMVMTGLADFLRVA
jgi:MarC family membrane protein